MASTGRSNAGRPGCAVSTSAGFKFDDLLVNFDRTDFKDLGRGVGLIGNGVLANFDLVLDYSARTLSIRPNARFSAS